LFEEFQKCAMEVQESFRYHHIHHEALYGSGMRWLLTERCQIEYPPVHAQNLEEILIEEMLSTDIYRLCQHVVSH
jgi:hypothetical protein